MGPTPSLPWWIKYAASAGVGLLSAFAATVVPSLWQYVLVGAAIVLLGIAGIGTVWHWWRHKGGNVILLIGMFGFALASVACGVIYFWQTAKAIAPLKDFNVTVYLGEEMRIEGVPIKFTNRNELIANTNAYFLSPESNGVPAIIPTGQQWTLTTIIVRNLAPEDVPPSKVTIVALTPFRPITDGFHRMMDTQVSWDAPPLPNYTPLGRENYYSILAATPGTTKFCISILIEAVGYNPYVTAACQTFVDPQAPPKAATPAPQLPLGIGSNRQP